MAHYDPTKEAGRSQSQGASRPVATRHFFAITLAYAAFVVYGSLVPLDFHYRPFAEALAAFRHTPYLRLGIGSRADWVANILLYIPLAFVATSWLTMKARAGALSAGILVIGLCGALAVGVEFAQLYFPPRTVSLNDIIAEFIGSGLGIVLAVFAGEWLFALWADVIHGGHRGTQALIALYALSYLGLALFPFDFVVSPSELGDKLANTGRTAFFVSQACGGLFGCSGKLLSEVIVAAPLGIFFGMVVATKHGPALGKAFGLGILLGVVIEGMQAFLASGVSQGASVFTRGIGMALGVAVHRSFHKDLLVRYGTQIRTAVLFALPVYAALLLAMNGFFTSSIQGSWAAWAKLREVHFLPFYYHYFTSETEALYSLLAHAGVYAPIGLMVWIMRDGERNRVSPWLAAVVAAVTALTMETLKLFLVGKRPDPTDVLIAAVAAALACTAATHLTRWSGADAGASAPVRAGAPQAPPRRRQTAVRLVAVAASVLVVLIAVVGWVIAIQPREHYVDESTLPQLPAPLDTAAGESARIQGRPSAVAESFRRRCRAIDGRESAVPAQHPQPRGRRQG